MSAAGHDSLTIVLMGFKEGIDTPVELLQTAFGVDHATAQRFFDHMPVVVKSGADKVAARAYVQTLHNIGALVQVQQDAPPAPLPDGLRRKPPTAPGEKATLGRINMLTRSLSIPKLKKQNIQVPGKPSVKPSTPKPPAAKPSAPPPPPPQASMPSMVTPPPAPDPDDLWGDVPDIGWDPSLDDAYQESETFEPDGEDVAFPDLSPAQEEPLDTSKFDVSGFDISDFDGMSLDEPSFGPLATSDNHPNPKEPGRETSEFQVLIQHNVSLDEMPARSLGDQSGISVDGMEVDDEEFVVTDNTAGWDVQRLQNPPSGVMAAHKARTIIDESSAPFMSAPEPSAPPKKPLRAAPQVKPRSAPEPPQPKPGPMPPPVLAEPMARQRNDMGPLNLDPTSLAESVLEFDEAQPTEGVALPYQDDDALQNLLEQAADSMDSADDLSALFPEEALLRTAPDAAVSTTEDSVAEPHPEIIPELRQRPRKSSSQELASASWPGLARPSGGTGSWKKVTDSDVNRPAARKTPPPSQRHTPRPMPSQDDDLAILDTPSQAAMMAYRGKKTPAPPSRQFWSEVPKAFTAPLVGSGAIWIGLVTLGAMVLAALTLAPIGLLIKGAIAAVIWPLAALLLGMYFSGAVGKSLAGTAPKRSLGAGLVMVVLSALLFTPAITMGVLTAQSNAQSPAEDPAEATNTRPWEPDEIFYDEQGQKRVFSATTTSEVVRTSRGERVLVDPSRRLVHLIGEESPLIAGASQVPLPISPALGLSLLALLSLLGFWLWPMALAVGVARGSAASSFNPAAIFGGIFKGGVRYAFITALGALPATLLTVAVVALALSTSPSDLIAYDTATLAMVGVAAAIPFWIVVHLFGVQAHLLGSMMAETPNQFSVATSNAPA